MRDRPRHVREIERLLEKGVNEEKLMWVIYSRLLNIPMSVDVNE